MREVFLFKCSLFSNAYIRKYNPIAEYGGWGVRDGWFKFKIFMTKAIRVDDTNIAYNMSGNIGLQLKLINDKRVLIGTRKSTKMEDVLRKLGKWKEE